MPTFLDTPSGGAHPSVLAYLSGGSPIRQSYIGALQTPRPPGVYVPPAPQAPPNPATMYGTALLNNGFNPLQQPNYQHVGAFGAEAPMPTPTGGGAAPSFNPGTLDYQNDPILQQVLAAQQAAVTTARGNLLSNYKDLLLGYGSKQVAADTLKTLLKQPGYKDLAGAKDLSKYLNSISDNPDTSQSTLARLARALREATKGTNEQISSSQGGNLFFSGTHARALRDLNYESQSQTADAAQALRQALFAAMQGETATESQWQQNVLSAEEAAYSRALEFALAQAARAAGMSGGGFGGATDTAAPLGGGTPYTQAPAVGGGQSFVPWQVATALSKLSPTDLRVRRLQ